MFTWQSLGLGSASDVQHTHVSGKNNVRRSLRLHCRRDKVGHSCLRKGWKLVQERAGNTYSC